MADYVGSESVSSEASGGLALDRRRMFQMAALLGGSLAMGERALAAPVALPSRGAPGMARIGSNEYWEGPVPDAVAAVREVTPHCNYYDPDGECDALIKLVASMEKVPVDHVVPWAGSTSPLVRSVLGMCSPERGLVTANPTFEVAWTTAEYMGVPLVKVPLRASDQAHDVRAMVAANPKAGLFYICNPNNPTGSLTPKEDIAWLLANKPAGSIVLLDEAYLHFSEAESGMDFVRSGADVVILRTFSKIFGMAGMRMGLSIGRPELLEKLMMADGHVLMGQLPVPALVCATASLKRPDLIAARRTLTARTRATTAEFLRGRGFKVLPSEANMLMVDWGRPAAPIKAAFEARGVVIGRSWTIWPTMSRITIGSPAEMQRFCAAVDPILRS